MDRDDRLEIIEPIVTQIDEILARPEVETDADGNVIGGGLSSDDKLVDIGLARFMPYWRAKKEANGERPTISLGYLSKVLGMPKRRISKSLDRQSGLPEDGAPFEKIVGRKPMVDDQNQPVLDEHGNQRWESSLEVIPWGDNPAATLRAAATYSTPVRPKHGGTEAATAVRWGRCDKHRNREVRVKGYCPDCGKVVGERTVTRAEFDALNVQVEHSEGTSPTVSGSNPIEVQVGHSERQPVNLGRIRFKRDQPHAEPPQRCSAPGCRALEFKAHPDGSWRCLKSAHDPRDYEPLAAVAGGSE
jgi:hypothetical protein